MPEKRFQRWPPSDLTSLTQREYSAHQGCIYSQILFYLNCFQFKCYLNDIYFCDGKAEFQQPLLQLPVLHNLSEITIRS